MPYGATLSQGGMQVDSCAGQLCRVFLRTHQRVPAGSDPDALRGGPFLSVPLLPLSGFLASLPPTPLDILLNPSRCLTACLGESKLRSN